MKTRKKNFFFLFSQESRQIRRVLPSLNPVDGNDRRQGQSDKQCPQKAKKKKERKRKQMSEVSISIRQGKQGTFQNLTTGLGTGSSDHLTVGADQSCRSYQLPHPGLRTDGDSQLAVHKSQGPRVSPFSCALQEITHSPIPNPAS